MYRFLFTIVFFGKRKNNTHETFHILKIKTHSETHYENENIQLTSTYLHTKSVQANGLRIPNEGVRQQNPNVWANLAASQS